MTLKPSSVFAVAAILGLIGCNVGLYQVPVDISAIAKSSNADRVAERGQANQSSLQLSELNDLEVLERPLFTPTRRNFVPIVQPEEKEPDVSQEATPLIEETEYPAEPLPSLLGIGKLAGNSRALLSGSRTTGWFGKGEDCEGWIIADVGKDEVVLERGSRTAHISLYPDIPCAPEISGSNQ